MNCAKFGLPTWMVGGLLINLLWLIPAWGAKYVPAKAAFSVRCNDVIFGYEVQALFLLPGETVDIEILDANWHSRYGFQPVSGTVQAKHERQWRWTLPEKTGLVTAQIYQIPSGQRVTLNALVMVPYAELHHGRLRGCRIGDYPEPRQIGGAFYAPPRGFVEVTPTAMQLPVSPHFTLGQFVCKEPGGFPKYLVLDERLVVKLEALLERVNSQGYRCRSLGISCGYRTPRYNAQQGYSSYSSHMYGQAADIYADTDGTGLMGDLNHDGRRDERDAKIIGGMVENLEGTARHQDLVGGLGLYETNRGHGTFVHVDVRGARARWENVSGHAPHKKSSEN
ncbi:MAG: hypothetical protein HGA76_09915 [Candidatus Firestonebacteria bacterium]|nr:hypothetical protein [Candidatus Firestonebacteria bacterium]